MRRSRYLAMLTIIGVVLTGATYQAQQERAALEVQEITDNLYVLANASSVQGMGGGGNTAIFIATDGVALVDTKINGYGQDIIARVGELTDKPITTRHQHPHPLRPQRRQHRAARHRELRGAREHPGPDVTRHLPAGDQLRRLQGRERGLPAQDRLLRAHVALQRRGPHRPLSLRPRPHRRRHVRGLPGRAHHAHRRHVPAQGAAVHRRRQRQRQRHRVRRDAEEGSGGDLRTSTP